MFWAIISSLTSHLSLPPSPSVSPVSWAQSVLLSHFSMTLEIEAQTTVDMVRQLVLPAALEQQERLASAINEAQTAGDFLWPSFFVSDSLFFS